MEQVEPRYARLHAAPLAWSASTKGAVVGEPLLTPLETSFMIGPKRLRTALDEYRKTWKGKLRGRIVLLTSPRPISNRSSPLFTRYTESAFRNCSGLLVSAMLFPFLLRPLHLVDRFHDRLRGSGDPSGAGLQPQPLEAGESSTTVPALRVDRSPVEEMMPYNPT